MEAVAAGPIFWSGERPRPIIIVHDGRICHKQDKKTMSNAVLLEEHH